MGDGVKRVYDSELPIRKKLAAAVLKTFRAAAIKSG